MIKNVIVVFLVAFLLCACSNTAPSVETSVQALASAEKADTPSPAPTTLPVPSPVSTQEPSIPATGLAPALRAASVLDDGVAVIAEHLCGNGDSRVFLSADEAIYDLLITFVSEEEGVAAELSSVLYLPELAAGQAIALIDPNSLSDEQHWRVAYTNSGGEYEATLLSFHAQQGTPSLTFTEPNLYGAVYDESYNFWWSEEFSDKLLSGAFDRYVPKGLRISMGSLGDINLDGREDALICLTSDGYCATAYGGIMPMFLLTGQPGGEYAIEKVNADALFTPYRSSCNPVAGNGYFDIVYGYVGGAACHHTQIFRFSYSPEDKDWLLSEFFYQPTYTMEYEAKALDALVRPLPNFADMPFDKFENDVYYTHPVDWDYFDAVGELPVLLWGENPDIYTLAVTVNDAEGYYEGHIFKYYETLGSGGFIQTIRGEYAPGTELTITADEEEASFTIQGDTWKMDEYDEDAFHLMK